MRRAPMACLILIAAIVFANCPVFGEEVKPEARKTEEKALYPDGSLYFRVPLNARGERHGHYTAFYKGGKKLRERVHYENGERNGTREMFDDNGQLLVDEFWVHGKLVIPKSMKMIEAARARIGKEASAYVRKMPPPSNPRAPGAEFLAGILAKINVARYVADVPDDVGFDDHYIDLAQHAAELMAQLGQLTHSPGRPSGMDDQSYELGREGCGQSNIFQGKDPSRSIDSYLNDSDPSNIDRVGHRRWVLNPAMSKTGIGVSGRFSALYSWDKSRQEIPDYDFVCDPPRGLCPLDMFGPSWAWHVSVNMAKFKVSDDATLEIFPVDAKLVRAAHAVALEYAHVDRGGFGIRNAIIVRPNPEVVKPGVTYEVVVHGVSSKEDDKPAAMSYYVSFYGQ